MIASGDSHALRRNVGRFVFSGEYDSEADILIVEKDVTLAKAFGRNLDVPLLVDGAMSSVYRVAEYQGFDSCDPAVLLALHDPMEDVGLS